MSGPQFNNINYRDIYNKGVNAIKDKYNTGVNAMNQQPSKPLFSEYSFVPQPNPNFQMDPNKLPHSSRGGKLHKKKKSTKRRYKKKGGSKKNYKNYKKTRRMH